MHLSLFLKKEERGKEEKRGERERERLRLAGRLTSETRAGKYK